MNYSPIASGLALLVALASCPGPARADDTSKKLGDLAKQIHAELEQMNYTEVGVEGFNDTGRLESSAGPMIQSRLIAELKKCGITINPKANVYVTGEYLTDKKAEKGYLGIKLVCILREQSGDEVKRFTTTIGYKSNEDLVKLLALSVDLTEYAKSDPEEVNKYLKEKKEEPQVYTKDDEIKVRKDSPFAVKILAAKAHSKDDAFEHRPGKVEKGHTRVSLHAGEEYRILVCNTSKNEVVVTITIDGLDAFEFFTTQVVVGRLLAAYHLEHWIRIYRSSI